MNDDMMPADFRMLVVADRVAGVGAGVGVCRGVRNRRGRGWGGEKGVREERGGTSHSLIGFQKLRN
jgi:hypothetical protein